MRAKRLRRLFRTSVFQITLAYAALFAVSVGALSLVLYSSTLGYLEHQNNAVIEAEINGLSEQYERSGLAGLADIINERVERDAERRSVYLLADAIGRPLAGNVPYWPSTLDAVSGEWVDFVKRDDRGNETPVRAALLRVGPGFRLLVGRDIREQAAIRRELRRAATYAVTLAIGLALVGGLLIALSAQRRLAEINRTTRQIMAGDLSQRTPLKGSNDEHDELASNINAMLDQIENLLAGMRHVADSVAHDLRGPLTRLRNRLETLATAAQPSHEDLGECVQQLDQVLETFNALLRIARVESGAYRSAFKPVDLAPIVRDVCELYQAAADERQIRLIGEPSGPVEVFGDRELLAQALTNLLDNAVKYTPTGGTISVRLEQKDDKARLSVADSGPGVPESDRDRVLQRFTRLDQARSQPGAGLGLALVNAVTMQHHGRLTLGDNAPGLVVTLELPALSAPRTSG
ncbi:MAG TPA: HAMP domain-containing sensor histidine kinase [Gammaproteobacteria bacterium]|nr:HAMP domain-containing sensor histidine kinase [Gammaproteobacteria bacterium]